MLKGNSAHSKVFQLIIINIIDDVEEASDDTKGIGEDKFQAFLCKCLGSSSFWPAAAARTMYK
jgi:hypothetical protein